jgi:transposase
MPWKESSVMDERIRFVIRMKDGESMAALCREFGISRKTGYKILDRYEECGGGGVDGSSAASSEVDPNGWTKFGPA